MMTWMRTPMGLPHLARVDACVRIITRRRGMLVAGLVLLSACSSPTPAPRNDATLPSPTPSSKAIIAGPNCRLPEEKPLPNWMPKEVPLPPGTYFYRSLPPKRGLDRGHFVMRIDANAFQSFVDTSWDRAGIRLLRPDREPGEVEALFTTSRGTGVFKANDVVCRTPYTRLLLIYGK